MTEIFQDKFKTFLIFSLLAFLGVFSAWLYGTISNQTRLRNIEVPRGFQFSYDYENNDRWTEYIKNPLPTVIHYGDKSSNKIALTFDDGPNNKTFNKLLDILKEKNVKATFFMVGSQIKKYPHQVIRANKEGHQLGNHTLSHDRITGLSEHQIIEEVESVRTQIYRLTGKLVYLFRPPGGQLDKLSLETILKLKYTTVMWTENAGDWDEKEKTTNVFKRVMQTKGGGIVLMHGISWQTVLVMPDIIDNLREQGYEFVTIDHILPDTNLQANTGQYARN